VPRKVAQINDFKLMITYTRDQKLVNLSGRRRLTVSSIYYYIYYYYYYYYYYTREDEHLSDIH